VQIFLLVACALFIISPKISFAQTSDKQNDPSDSRSTDDSNSDKATSDKIDKALDQVVDSVPDSVNLQVIKSLNQSPNNGSEPTVQDALNHFDQMSDDQKMSFWATNIWSATENPALEAAYKIYLLTLKKYNLEKSKFQGSAKEFKENVIDKGKIHEEIKGVGTGQVSTIDGSPIFRIVTESNQKSYILYSADQFDTKGAHFVKFVARQHIWAGSTRTDKQAGRDVQTVMVDSTLSISEFEFKNPQNHKYLPRPDKNSLAFWKQYWKSIAEKPTRDTAFLGVISSVPQTVIAASMSAALYSAGYIPHMDFTPAILSQIWGFGVGTYVGTFKNWQSNGTWMTQTLKSAANSLAFGYVLLALTNPEGVYGLFNMDVATLWLHFTVINNVIANSFAKNFHYQWARSRETARISTKLMSPIKIPFIKDPFVMKQSQLEYQASYLPAFTIRLFDYMSYAMNLPIGKIVLWGSIPVFWRFSVKYTEKLARENPNPDITRLARELRAAWEKMLLTVSPGSKEAWRYKYLLFSEKFWKLKGHSKIAVNSLAESLFGSPMPYLSVDTSSEDLRADMLKSKRHMEFSYLYDREHTFPVLQDIFKVPVDTVGLMNLREQFEQEAAIDYETELRCQSAFQ
jgi:hypothetical protein